MCSPLARSELKGKVKAVFIHRVVERNTALDMGGEGERGIFFRGGGAILDRAADTRFSSRRQNIHVAET
eukprot:CAMPEP_0182474314 /NCGR_PEP_ID=MMETSP1319-20130603/25419_1 /TAXON_ID=172717 /ORGANISM="Bolidomonas pacifica, Strain RCC208" /LENGTH=68 /DNA_ID=CAMNT_0024675185 /DNA_START=272 /DNA_END=478 /DNA_ORIENTATION=+